MKKIYIATTEEDAKKGHFKIGETGRDTSDRAKELNTGTPDKVIMIWECNSVLRDKAAHEYLKRHGYYNVSGEWYGEFKSKEEVITVMNRFISESPEDTRVKYNARFYQNLTKNKFLEKYESELKFGYDKIDFGLEFGQRFGKTIWQIDILHTLFKIYNIKLCVLPSYVLTTLSSFEKDLNSFNTYSSEFILVNIDDNLESIIKDNYGKKLIVVQMSLHSEDYMSKLNCIAKLPSKDKISIIDEADFGAHTRNSREKIDYLDCHLNLYMSGTAIDRATYPLSNLRDNVLRFSYTEILMVKNGVHPIQLSLSHDELEKSKKTSEDIVIPRFFKLSLGNVINNFNEVPDEYKTDWNKLFADVDKSKPILSNLIKSLFGEYNGKLTYLVDLDTSELCPKNVTMIFAGTPNKTQQKKFSKLVQETLGPKYIVVLINSDETSNRKVEDKVKIVIARAIREGKKVVLISKDMASRSFSIPEIDTNMLLYDRGSYAANGQKIARVFTSGKTYYGDKKIYGDIISLSLDPNRVNINPIDEYIVYESEKVQVNELSDGINRVLRSINIFVNDNGMLEPIIIDEYVDKLISSSTLIRIGVEGVKVDCVINDTELIKLLTGVEVNKKNNEERIEGIDSSKVIRTEGEKVKNGKTNSKVVEDLKQKIKEVLSNIVESVIEITEINNCESNNIIETLDMIYEKGLCEEVIHEVGVNSQTVKNIILTGALSEKLLNTIITSYNKEENLISL